MLKREPWTLLFYLAVLSDTVAAGIVGYALWRQRRHDGGIFGFVRDLAILMFSIAAEGWGTLISLNLRYHATGLGLVPYQLPFFIFRAIRCAALWAVVVRMVRK